MTFIEDVDARLNSAIDRYQEAKKEIVHASIHLLCTRFRDEFPKAKTLEFEWSDQGAWLILSSYDNGEDVEDFDDDSLSSNLDDTTEGLWGAYMTDVSGNGNRFQLDINTALLASATELGAQAPSDPAEIEEFLKS